MGRDDRQNQSFLARHAHRLAARERVRVHSELWRARSPHPLASGPTVRVTGKEGLVLTVVPTHKEA